MKLNLSNDWDKVKIKGSPENVGLPMLIFEERFKSPGQNLGNETNQRSPWFRV